MLEHLPDTVIIGRHEVPIRIKRNRRAKRIYLRYNPTDHAFSLTLPQRTRWEEGMAFVQSQGDWLAQTLQQLPARKKLKAGITLPVLGQMVTVRYDSHLPAPFALRDNQLLLGGERKQLAPRIEQALKKIVRHELRELAEFKAERLGRSINRLTLRDTHSRWGSCTTEQNLMFSWRLVFAPYEVLDYVVSHEVAHLRHMNHSPAFWSCVESICPDYRQWKDWLKLHGKELYRFTSE